MLRRIPMVLLVVVGLLGVTPRADAAEPTSITVSGPATAAGDQVVLTVDVTSTGAGVAGAPVTVERQVGGAWSAVGQATTDAVGRAQVAVPMSPVAADNVFRASYAGDAARAPARTEAVAVALVRRPAVVGLTGAGSVVEERSTTLQVQWIATNGAPVSGAVLLTRLEGKRWVPVQAVPVGLDGRGSVSVAPLDATRYRVLAPELDWVTATASPELRVDVLPSGVPVRLPRAAPEPRITLPPQPHAVGDGANPVVTAIPDGVWRSMVGRSWHAGCPVGRAGLRLVRINYWDFDGYRRRGELVVAAGAASQVVGALADMYAADLPIRSIYRVDRFGWSSRLNGADDYRSMAADNTSAFNCRSVVNRPGVRSPHSWGRSLDVNTWENPYRSATGLVPDAWWHSRSDPRVAWRSRSHAVVRIMAAHGLRWTYGTGDSQHFDAARGNGRVVAPRVCVTTTCH